MPVLDHPIAIPLPKDWSQRVRSGAIHAISLARFSLTAARGHVANSWNTRIRLREENDRLRQEVELLVGRHGGRKHLPVVSLKRVA